MMHYARNQIYQMGRNLVNYNNVMCCSATGVQNNEAPEFCTIHWDHTVRLHSRTHRFLTDSHGNAVLNVSTFDNLTSCTH